MNHIPEHFKYIEHEFIMDLFYGFGIDENISPLLKEQSGGNKEQIMKFIDVGGVYTYSVYTEDKNDTDLRISILSASKQDCVTILIFGKRHLAILHSMSHYDDCALEGLGRPGGSNKLLRFALNLIMKHQDKYDIKRIVLKDNSFLYCKGFQHRIKLAQIRMFTHGYPWYVARYGFKPYDTELAKPSIELLESIKKNQLTIDAMKTKQFDIIGIITKEKLNVDVHDVKALIDQYPSMKQFITRLTDEFDKYCQLIYYILDSIYMKVPRERLENFHGKVFYLDI